MNINLTEWDFRLIDYLKRNERPTLLGIKEIWAERNALDIEHIRDDYIMHAMLEIVVGLELEEFTRLVEMANPTESWKYPLGAERGETPNYVRGWISALGSVLRLAEVKDLPGYLNWHTTNCVS